MIGIDRRDFEGRPKDIEHHQIDIRRKKTQDIFRQEQLAAVGEGPPIETAAPVASDALRNAARCARVT